MFINLFSQVPHFKNQISSRNLRSFFFLEAMNETVYAAAANVISEQGVAASVFWVCKLGIEWVLHLFKLSYEEKLARACL